LPAIVPASAASWPLGRHVERGDIVSRQAASTAGHASHHEGNSTMSDNAQNEQVVKDPVCQMKIRPSDAVASIEHAGTTYHFCSQDCADAFRESPEDYV
jgi:YHS domain-containing protein